MIRRVLLLALPLPVVLAGVLGDEYRRASWADWDSPERIVITVATIDRHRRGEARRVGARERASLFAQVASLAAELER